MLAVGVIILLLYLFFREYKLRKTQVAKSEPTTVHSRPTFPIPVPLSHAHIQTMQTVQPTAMAATVAATTSRFETDSNLDRELSAEISDLCRQPDVDEDVKSDAGSQSTADSSSHTASGSPVRQIIEFVPRKMKRKTKADV